MAICAGLAFHGCGVAASGPLNAPAKAAGLRPAEPARVLIVGSFHFDDAGQDAVKAVHKDVMQPAEQRYIERLAKRLAAFRPTHVLLEFPESAHGRVNAEYQAWREGRAPLASVEGFIRQILGWREYVRGVYWARMPGYVERNHLGHERALFVGDLRAAEGHAVLVV